MYVEVCIYGFRFFFFSRRRTIHCLWKSDYITYMHLLCAIHAMQVQKSGERVDVMHYHVNEGRWEGSWEDGHDMYRQILQVRLNQVIKSRRKF